MTVSELIQRIRDGPEPDQDFDELAGRYLAFILRHVRRYVHNPADVEDRRQEVLIAAFKHIRDYDPHKGTFATWLHTIIHNQCISYLRHQHLEQDCRAGYEVTHECPSTPALERLPEYLALLPEPCRVVAWEHWGLGWSIEETADRHGLSPRHVRYLLAMAMAALRRDYGVHRPGRKTA